MMDYKLNGTEFGVYGVFMLHANALQKIMRFSLLFCSGLAQGEIITDGKLGSYSVHLNSTQMTIDQTLGKVAGHNLFHSFKVFNINKDQTVTFTGSKTINNVISRVTGNHASHINGLLESKVGRNFYFINPNGVMFGEGAKVDVPGAFHVSTADGINFKDGKIFSASHPINVSSLTSSPPESFGFLEKNKSNSGNIIFNNTDITNFSETRQENQKVYFTAKNIIIDNGSQIKNSSGEIHLSAVGNIKYTENLFNKNSNIKNMQNKGNLYIDNRSTIDTSGNGAGLVNIRTGNLSISNESVISSQNEGNINANNKGIYIRAANAVNIINGGQIKTNANSAGTGGNIEIYSKQLNINGYKKDDIKLNIQNSAILSESGCSNACGSWGNGGNIKIKSQTITIADSGAISSSNYGVEKNAGKIDIESNSITIDGKNQDATTRTEISSNACINNSSDCKNGNSNAGLISINSHKINIKNNASISTTVSNINGNSGKIIINDKPEYSHNSIIKLFDSDIKTSAQNNNGGNIKISGKALVLNGGIVQANANTDNKSGGKITINTDTLLVSHGQLQLGGIKHDNFPPGFNVIQAVSEKGETGTVTSTRPELNINGSMLKLKSNLLSTPDLNTTPCKTSQGSSLIQMGYGGLPRKPSEGVYIPSQSITTKTASMVTQHAIIKNKSVISNCTPH